MEYEGLKRSFEPNGRGLIDNILRKGTPDRVYHMELFHDGEIREAIMERFDLGKDLDPNDPDFERRRFLAFQQFLGFDYVRANIVGADWRLKGAATADSAELSRGERWYADEHAGPITNWEEFEQYAWPDPHAPGLMSEIEWWAEHLPGDMCLLAGGLGHFCEFLTWIMGYETLCFALHDQRDLVKAVADRLRGYFRVVTERVLAIDRVEMIFPSDDMGFKGGTLISPDDIREFCLPGHKMTAQMAHAAGRPSILHSCGNLNEIIDDLIDDVGIDAKHSFEDTIEDVRDVKKTYGQKIGLIGGIDVDFLCRADEGAIRKRVRETVDICQDGGGYCLGSGNSVTNYIPPDNYLTMVDEGRLYGG